MKVNHTYKGLRNEFDSTIVLLDGEQFDHRPSLKVRKHSPTGFEWNYTGSGPAQLALAILLKETDKETAQRLYQIFKEEVIATLDKYEWTLKSSDVRVWIEDCLSRLNTLQKE